MVAAIENNIKKMGIHPRGVVGKVQLAASYGFPAENRSLLCNLC